MYVCRIQWEESFLKPKELAVVEIMVLYPIGNVIYYSASGGAAAIAYLVCPETPKWADDVADVAGDTKHYDDLDDYYDYIFMNSR